jgi:hypothetical protein
MLPSSLLPLTPALLVILGLALVYIHTNAAPGRPGRNFIPLCLPALKSSLLILSFNQWISSSSSFGNLILAWADAPFRLVSAPPIHLLRSNYM